MTISTVRTVAVVLVTLLMAAPQAAASSADTASGDEPAAAYGADHLVVAGAIEPGFEGTNTPFGRLEYMAYYPANLQIHRNDVVFFQIVGFHTVTFSPEGEPREGPIRRDEVEPLTAFQHFDASDPTCGTSAEAAPCVLESPDQFVNSGWKLFGAIVNDLKLQVDLPEGAYTYYCTVHPGMEGTIEVVPDDEPIPSPTDVAAQREAEIAADTATGHDILANPPTMRDPENVPATPTSPAHRRWFVQAGQISADQRVSVFQYFPPSLPIAPGDEVEFFVPATGGPLPGRTEPVADYHTVSFEPQALHDNAPGEIRYTNPMCDPDDPGSGLPGVPMFSAILFGCPDEALTLELGIHPWMHPRSAMRAPGNAVATEATYDDSGILLTPDAPCRINCDPWTGERWPSTSTSSFPNEGEFVYRCFLHGRIMSGGITVSG